MQTIKSTQMKLIFLIRIMNAHVLNIFEIPGIINQYCKNVNTKNVNISNCGVENKKPNTQNITFPINIVI